jgi:uncharacterized protein involved in exopolysaccharide biosynthesis
MVMVAAAILAVIATYILPTKYTARGSILLDAGGDGMNLLNLAQMTDLLPPGVLQSAGRKENGYAYLAIAQSRSLLTDLLHRPQLSNPGRSYLDSFQRIHASEPRRTEIIVKELRESIALDFDARNGVLQIAVTNPNPVIAADIANQLVLELKRFNSDVRDSKARDAVRFVEARSQEAKAALTKAEDQLADFNRANLRIGTSPSLELQQKRLERNVRFNEEAYALLAKQLEISRIEEKKESSVFTAMDQAIPPTKPNRFPRVIAALLAAFISGTAFFLFASWRALAQSDPSAAPEWGDAKGAA